MSEEEEWKPEAGEESSDEEEEEEYDKDEDSLSSVPSPVKPTTTKTTSRKRKRQSKNDNAATLPPPPSIIPESLMEYVITNLQSGDESTVRETLLRLARLFREQSALCLQQAQRLDRMAVQQEEFDETEVMQHVSTESCSSAMQRQNQLCLLAKSSDMMIHCQETLDSIESRLVPWNQKIEESQKPRKKKGLSAYNLFTTDQFDVIASRLGTRKMTDVLPELAKVWRSIPEQEKEVYRERMREINKERTENNKKVDAEMAKERTEKNKKVDAEMAKERTEKNKKVDSE